MSEFVGKIDKEIFEIKINDWNSLLLNGEQKSYSLVEISKSEYILKLDDKVFKIFYNNTQNGSYDVYVNNKKVQASINTLLEEKAYQLLAVSKSGIKLHTEIKSPMPGLVLKVIKNQGESVSKGETVMILEAMKMENEIKAPIDGIIDEITVKVGLPVEKNLKLFSIK